MGPSYKFEIWVDKGAKAGESKDALESQIRGTLSEELSFFLHQKK